MKTISACVMYEEKDFDPSKLKEYVRAAMSGATVIFDDEPEYKNIPEDFELLITIHKYEGRLDNHGSEGSTSVSGELQDYHTGREFEIAVAEHRTMSQETIDQLCIETVGAFVMTEARRAQLL